MASQLAYIRSVAQQMVNAANAAIEAKAKIGSPSKVTTQYGAWYGQGYVNGIASKTRDAKRVAEKLFSVPAVSTPRLSGVYDPALPADYDYYRDAEYTIVVPLSVDGREFARATAGYTQAELDRQQTRVNRRHGKG